MSRQRDWSEAEFSAHKAKEFRTVGAQIFVSTLTMREGPGWPDWHVDSRHFSGWLELKVDRNTLSDTQNDKMQLLWKEGAKALIYVWDNATQAEYVYLPYIARTVLHGNPVDRLKTIERYWYQNCGDMELARIVNEEV